MGMRLMLGGVGRRSEGGQSANNNGNGSQSNGNMNGGNHPQQSGGQHWGNPGPGMVNAYGPQQNYGMNGQQMNGGMGALNMGMMNQGYPMENRGMGFTAPMEDFMPGSGRGVMPRSEEYLPDLGDVEARRYRSRRTGRFIRGEGDEGAEMHYGSRHSGRDDDAERGSYSHSEGGEDGGALGKLKKKFHKLKERLEEAEEAVQTVKELKKEVKRLREKLEEKDGEASDGKEGKKGKKSKSHEDDDDDDDEDDPAAGLKRLVEEGVDGREFLKCLPYALESLMEVLASPPRTWPPYLEKADYSGIYIMEAKELMRAIEQYKAGQKGLKDVEREMKHTGAALVQMFANLLHNLENEQD